MMPEGGVTHVTSPFGVLGLDGSGREAHTVPVPKNLTAPQRNAYYTSATGRTYWIDAKGLATEVKPKTDDEYQDEQDMLGCECEQDWNCGRHGGTSRPTWIETRYYDDPEEYR